MVKGSPKRDRLPKMKFSNMWEIKNLKNLTNQTSAHKIFEAINSYSSGSEVRYVGGCIRKILNKENVDDIDELIIEMLNFDGAVIAIPSVDTVKYSENNIIMKTIDRNSIWLAQTPQVFWKDKLLKAYDKMDESIVITDEASIMEKMGYKICLIPGDIKNNKITTFEDWKYAESRLK